MSNDVEGEGSVDGTRVGRGLGQAAAVIAVATGIEPTGVVGGEFTMVRKSDIPSSAMMASPAGKPKSLFSTKTSILSVIEGEDRRAKGMTIMGNSKDNGDGVREGEGRGTFDPDASAAEVGTEREGAKGWL